VVKKISSTTNSYAKWKLCGPIAGKRCLVAGIQLLMCSPKGQTYPLCKRELILADCILTVLRPSAVVVCNVMYCG